MSIVDQQLTTALNDLNRLKDWNDRLWARLRGHNDVLQALRDCLPDLERHASTHGPGPDRRLATAKAAIAKAAIAKAATAKAAIAKAAIAVVEDMVQA